MDNLNLQHVGDNPVDHPPLKPKPGGTVTLPITGKGFVVKPFDSPQTFRPGKTSDVLPFFVTLQNLDRNGTRKLFVDAAVFYDLPHATLCIYYIWYVKDGMV